MSYKTLCNTNFQSQYAYIVKSLEETPTEQISIKKYLKDQILQKKISNSKRFLVCKHGHNLIKYKSDKRKSHFKHKSNKALYRTVSSD